MKYKALLVDDDPKICEAVGEILVSLGHDYQCAHSQEAARPLLAQGEYSYILLDLEIPVRNGAGFARLVNGENLLAEIRNSPKTRHMPVIVMTGYGSDGPSLAVRLMKKGAVDFVNKPFDGDVLDRAILDAIVKHERHPTPGVGAPANQPIKAFCGGELAIFENHIELCGVTILENNGRGHAWEILTTLAQQDDKGRFKPFGCRRLAEQLGRGVGENAVIQCIRGLRKRISELLDKEMHLVCGTNGVIMSRDQGYRLSPHITLRRSLAIASVTTAHAPSAAEVHTSTSEDLEVAELNERQRWIIAELGRGSEVRRNDVEARFKCSSKTAKRDLVELREAGRIEWVASPRPGHYRLAQTVPVA